MARKIVVPLLTGFEEIEAVTIIDVLRRAELEVVVAGEDAGPVEGSHGITVGADAALRDIDAGDVDMIVLPGGLPGAEHLKNHAEVQRLLRALADADRAIGAICAAPMALAPSGIHKDKRVTSYPGFAGFLPGAHYVEDRVVIDGKLITSRGPGTALEFALSIVGMLAGADAATALGNRMLAR